MRPQKEESVSCFVPAQAQFAVAVYSSEALSMSVVVLQFEVSLVQVPSNSVLSQLKLCNCFHLGKSAVAGTCNVPWTLPLLARHFVGRPFCQYESAGPSPN